MVIKVPGGHIISIGEGLRDLLERHWDVSNTDGVMPTIHFVHERKKVRTFGQDVVIVTNLEEFPEPVSLGYLWENVLYTGNIRLITSQGYDHSLRMKTELRRILMLNRIEPFKDFMEPDSGRMWLRIRRFTDRSARTRRLQEWNCDFEINHRYRAVDE